LSLGQRLLLLLPPIGAKRNKVRLSDRLSAAMLKPEDPDVKAARASKGPKTVEELEAIVRSADDKERLVGLLAAPFAGIIGILVIASLIANDPPALLKNGKANALHVSVGIYHELELVLLGLAVLMVVTALLRKRLYLGIVLALYGLAVFNLHYWGFGIPFVMFGAWLLVRSYRLQRELREANGEGPSTRGTRRGGTSGNRPRANKRYTPPSGTS
jgi:hypothetical protein